MIGKPGRLGVAALALALLVASALPSCGRSVTSSDIPLSDAGASGVGQGGALPDTNDTAGGEGGLGSGASAGEALGGATGGATGGEAGGAAGCVPGERVCDGPGVRVCGKDGTSTIAQLCGASEVCSQAECRAIACVPNAQFCKDGALRVCNATGTDSTQQQVCGDNQFCLEHDGKAECGDTACVPGAPTCEGSVATQCKADGSAPQSGGQDCAKKGQLCRAGNCVATVCTSGDKLCEHDDVYFCVDGASTVMLSHCQADEVCDPNLLACRKRICEPGKLDCDSTRVVTCNALGTGWDQSGKDCGASAQLCVAGACKTQECIPSSTFCKNGDVYQCDTTGISSSLSQTCTPAYYHCAVYPYQQNTSTCAYNTCTPGAAMCSGSVATKCSADGTGPQPGGTDCAPDSICDGYGGATCKPKLCTAGTYFCKGANVSYCQDGLNSYTNTTCPDDAPCAATADSVACVPYKCWPGLKSCVANQLGTCAADGMSLTSVKQDCNATEEVCVSDRACGQSAVDTVGAAEDLSVVGDGQLFGNAIDVQSNRKLTLLEANIVLAGARTLRWVVYELVDGYYISRFDVVVSNQTGTGYFSSGAISYTLKAGKRYVLAVAVTGGSFVPYYDALPWQEDVSFGKVKGGITSSYATSFYGYYLSNAAVYDMRVTTELP